MTSRAAYPNCDALKGRLSQFDLVSPLSTWTPNIFFAKEA